MKILHLLSGGGIGGIEILCRDIAELSKEKHEFCFLYRGGEIADEMQKKSQSVYFFYENSLISRIIRLINLVKKEQYDVIIVHHEGIGIYSFYLILTYLFKRIKFIKYLHCSFEKEYFYEGRKIKDVLNYSILKKVLRRSDHIVAVSEFVKKSYCKEFYLDTNKVSVVYNGIRFWENKSMSLENSNYNKDQEIRLLYIGRLIEVKGVRLLLYAVKNLIDSGKKVILYILGDGAQYTDYVKLAKKLEIEDSVYFEGYQLNKQPFYEQADIFVYPSIWQEAFGISIVEALAQGMICVASASGGIPEIIEDGKDGFLFERGNVGNLTETLMKASDIFGTSQHEAVREAAIRKAHQFDIVKMIDDLQKICRK